MSNVWKWSVFVLTLGCGAAEAPPSFLSRAQVDEVMTSAHADFARCGRDAQARGVRVETRFRIDLNGTVTSAEIVEPSSENEALEACLLQTIGALRFPEPDRGEVNVTYPLEFH